jgi:hypothetical protein
MDGFEAWTERLHAARNLVLTLARDSHGQRLNRAAVPTGVRVLLPAGTRIRYVETRYDAMRLDQALHTVKVLAGAEAGAWIGIDDLVGSDALPWKAPSPRQTAPR